MAGSKLQAISIIEVRILRQFSAPRYDPAIAVIITGAPFIGGSADANINHCSRV
jgi:hypothetical protein